MPYAIVLDSLLVSFISWKEEVKTHLDIRSNSSWCFYPISSSTIWIGDILSVLTTV
jgi:hypothetical protein